MQPSNRFALKEWGVVCAVLAEGRQSLILRKGGIHEGPEGFRIEHPEFWLFPTRFHQDPDEIIKEAHPLLDQVLRNQPPDDEVHISNYAVVEDVHRIEDELILPTLAGFHIWSHRTVDERFHYRTSGLFALTLRIYRRPETLVLPNSPHFAGCRSWVDFPDDISTDGLVPVLRDPEFQKQADAIRAVLEATHMA